MRARIDIIHAVHDGLGFAAGHFSEVLRLSWLPLLIAMLSGPLLWNAGWANPPQDGTAIFIPFFFALVYAPVVLVTQASVMVALVGTVVSGAPPHHRSAHFAFGPRELLFLLSAVLSAGVLLLLTAGPTLLVSGWIEGFAAEREQLEVFRFDDGSLHGGERNVLFPGGHPLRSLQPFLGFLAAGILVYLTLRLFLLPIFVAAGVRAPLAKTWRASGGANVLRLLLLLVLFVIVQYAVGVSGRFIGGLGLWFASLIGMVPAMLETWGLTFADPGWSERVAGWLGIGVSGAITLLLAVFSVGLFAGLTGAVVRQVEAAAQHG